MYTIQALPRIFSVCRRILAAVAPSLDRPPVRAATRARVEIRFTLSSSISTSRPVFLALIISRPPRTSMEEIIMPMLASVEIMAGLTRAIGALKVRTLGLVLPIEAQPVTRIRARIERVRTVADDPRARQRLQWTIVSPLPVGANPVILERHDVTHGG